ncbi:unnamed protein product [Mycena citricolor]|uniref:PWI domain-containing protein n=1 Tax=Mycena citricolor TaxID=2018698 RepID=A0AAD2HY20_9AGAR|nr:unnamed protein product [Mycena citricolor]
MADAGFFKGTSAEQDRRFVDKEAKLLRSTKFPANFESKVDMRKVNLNVIRPWIAKKIVELVGFEDDILIGYALELLDEPAPDPRKLQLSLQAFLNKDAPTFMAALWSLLIEAQSEVTGVPRTFVEEKKEELRRARESDTRTFDERDRRARIDEVSDNRRARGGWGGRGKGRGMEEGGGRGRTRDTGWGSRGGGPSRRSPRSGRPRSRSMHRRSMTPPTRRYRSPSRRRSISRDINSSRSPPPMRRSPPRRSMSDTRSSRSRSRTRSRSPVVGRRRARSRTRSRSANSDTFDRKRDSRSPPTRRRRLSSSANEYQPNTASRRHVSRSSSRNSRPAELKIRSQPPK